MTSSSPSRPSIRSRVDWTVCRGRRRSTSAKISPDLSAIALEKSLKPGVVGRAVNEDSPAVGETPCVESTSKSPSTSSTSKSTDSKSLSSCSRAATIRFTERTTFSWMTVRHADFSAAHACLAYASWKSNKVHIVQFHFQNNKARHTLQCCRFS